MNNNIIIIADVLCTCSTMFTISLQPATVAHCLIMSVLIISSSVTAATPPTKAWHVSANNLDTIMHLHSSSIRNSQASRDTMQSDRKCQQQLEIGRAGQ